MKVKTNPGWRRLARPLLVAYEMKLLKFALTRSDPFWPARLGIVAPFKVSKNMRTGLVQTYPKDISKAEDATKLRIGNELDGHLDNELHRYEFVTYQRTIRLGLHGITYCGNTLKFVEHSRWDIRAIVEEKYGKKLVKITDKCLKCNNDSRCRVMKVFGKVLCGAEDLSSNSSSVSSDPTPNLNKVSIVNGTKCTFLTWPIGTVVTVNFVIMPSCLSKMVIPEHASKVLPN